MVKSENFKKIRKNPEKIRKPDEIPEKKIILSKDFNKIRKNPEIIWKPDEIPEQKIIISHLRSKTSNLSRNMVKTIKI